MRVPKRANPGPNDSIINRKSNQSHRIGSIPGIAIPGEKIAHIKLDTQSSHYMMPQVNSNKNGIMA